MRVHVFEPGFVHRKQEPRYFVMQIGAGGFGYSDGYRYEIQLCNDALQGAAVILFRGDETEFSVPDFDVPEAVYRAAIRQPPGKGDFVDSKGESAQQLW
jgi:hypothetical protein